MSHVCRFCRAHIFKFEKGGKISSSFLGMPRGILKVVLYCVCPSIEHSIPYPTRVPVRRTFDTVSDTVCLSVEHSITYPIPCVCPSNIRYRI